MAETRGGKPRVVLIATGGTISMRRDAELGGAVPELSGAEILASVPGWEEHAEVEVREFGRYPGPHMTIERMWELRAAVLDAVRSGADGVAITHGKFDSSGEYETTRAPGPIAGFDRVPRRDTELPA